MLHEILFGLLGKSGNIIIEQNDSFVLDPKITFLTPAEKEIINSLCCLGYYYKNLEQFLDENYNNFAKITYFMNKNNNFNENNDDQNDGPIAEVNVIGNSAYLKGFCLGLEQIINSYREKIIEIERDFLENRVFTIASLKIKLTSHFDILPDLHKIVIKIVEENLKGGQLLDLMHSKSQTGNTALREVYQILTDQCYSVLYQQLSGWILYGNLQDYYDEFFIYRIEQTKSQQGNAFDKSVVEQPNELEIDWDSIFSLRYAMLPQSIVSHKQAEKILFIGKGIRILRNTQKEYENSFLPPQQMLTLIEEIRQYDSFKFQNTIESLRYEIAKQMLELVLKNQNLMNHLNTLNNYFLMGNGEFFKAFYEESRSLMQLPPKPESESHLNNVIVPHTLIRLRNDDEIVNAFKNFQFKIKNNGFEFKDFSQVNELNIFGNVHQQRNNYIRFQPLKNSKLSGSLWYKFKQNIEMGFKLSFTFRFKKERNYLPINQFSKLGSPNVNLLQSSTKGSVNLLQSEEQSPLKSRFSYFTSSISQDETNENGLLIVFQNTKEISSYKKAAPYRLQDMNEYVAIKFYTKETNKKGAASVAKEINDQKCSIQMVVCNNGTPTYIKNHEFDCDRVNFLDGQLQVIKINYDGENISLHLEDIDNMNRGLQSQLFTFPFKFNKFLNLDMGRAYVGFIQDSNNGNCAMDIMSWQMYSSNVFNNQDAWNGLTMDYQVKWPLNLMISSHLIEKYKTIFRYLFPLRTIQFELQRSWLYFMKNSKRGKLNPTLNQMLLMRTKLSSVIDSLWTYFHTDIITSQWSKLQEKVAEIKDFEELRKIIDLFLSSIQIQIFLSYPKLVKSIFDIVDCCRRYCNIVVKLEYDTSIDLLQADFEVLKQDFEKNFMNLLNLLILMTKNTNATFLFQLLLRLDFNGYYREKMEDKYKY
ncbi:hypothetical protein ABPG74_020148 [Tetrahymena malaccensis]